jgi:hypothetical protein
VRFFSQPSVSSGLRLSSTLKPFPPIWGHRRPGVSAWWGRRGNCREHKRPPGGQAGRLANRRRRHRGGAVGMDTDGTGRVFPVGTCLRRSPSRSGCTGGGTSPIRCGFLPICPGQEPYQYKLHRLLFRRRCFRIIDKHFCLDPGRLVGGLSPRWRLDGARPLGQFCSA